MRKDTQGEIRTAPWRGSERETGAMVFEGCGWDMCDRRETMRFAPAESPTRIMFLGAISSLLMTWLRSAAACCSCRG